MIFDMPSQVKYVDVKNPVTTIPSNKANQKKTWILIPYSFFSYHP